MTTEDKTGDKLVESIRRTKAGTGKIGAEPAAVKAAPRRQLVSKGGETEAQLPAVTKQAVSRDAYQSRGRVWPD